MKIFVAVLLLGFCFLAPAGEKRLWTSADGKSTFEGELLEFSETEVRIQRTVDRNTFKVPLEKLSEKDQTFIQGLLREKRRDTAVKDGPYAEKITGQFEKSVSEAGLNFQLFGNPKWKGEERYPLLIWLHGAGQSGADNESQMGKATKVFGSEESQDDHPCFILAPQCPSRDIGWKNEVEANVMALISDLADHLPIDENRIYLTGSSMGGFGSWRLAANHPQTFAAVVPICGGGNPGDSEKLKNDSDLGVFTAIKIRTCLSKKSREMVKAIESAGGELIKYSELAGEGHLIAGGVL